MKLIGSATACIGNPSGKSLERPDLDLDSLRRNTFSIQSTIPRILFENFVILNNYDWFFFSPNFSFFLLILNKKKKKMQNGVV